MDSESSISLNDAFACSLCKKIALQPSVARCCLENIICSDCISSGELPRCLFCRKLMTISKSTILNQIYRAVTVTCIYGCKGIINLNELKQHLSTCPEAPIDCHFCKQKLKINILPDHLESIHQEECSRILIQFHRENKKVVAPPPPDVQKHVQKIQPFKYKATVKLCNYGRSICGKEIVALIGGPITSSFIKKKQICCADTGSCNQCMEIDVDRLGLPKNYLLNLEGRVCFLIALKRKIACGCQFDLDGLRICNEEVQCSACRKQLDLVERGLYRSCFS